MYNMYNIVFYFIYTPVQIYAPFGRIYAPFWRIYAPFGEYPYTFLYTYILYT